MLIPIRLSPSKLNDFERCARCFWDANTGNVPKPRGIFPTLPGGMDLIMKNYVDQFRGKLPPALEDRLPGFLLSDMEKMKKWRFWKTGPTYIDQKNQITLVGALDDCLFHDGFYIPLDWKTKGSEPKDDGSQYYQTQMDCYNLMIEAQGLKIRNEAHLVYVYPLFAHDCEGEPDKPCVKVLFALKPYKLICSKEHAQELVIKAADCLRGSRPPSSIKCEHCAYLTMEDALSKQYEKSLS